MRVAVTRADGISFEPGDWLDIGTGIGKFSGAWENPTLGFMCSLNFFRRFDGPQECSALFISMDGDIKPDDSLHRAEFRKRAGAIEREIWIAAGRQLFSPGEREPCWVCERFKGIAQAHHVVPLTIQYDRGFKYPDQEYVWLCPNHHAMVHIFILNPNRSIAPAAFRSRGQTTRGVLPDLSEAEFQKMMELMRRAGRSPE